jgi:hypothetical protein
LDLVNETSGLPGREVTVFVVDGEVATSQDFGWIIDIAGQFRGRPAREAAIKGINA